MIDGDSTRAETSGLAAKPLVHMPSLFLRDLFNRSNETEKQVNQVNQKTDSA